MKKIILILITYFAITTFAQANNYIKSYKDSEGFLIKGVAVKKQSNYRKLNINNKSYGNKYSNPNDKYKNPFSNPINRHRNNNKRNLKSIKW